MTAPFSGEDLVKRSLFSSILGLKIRSPRYQHLENAGQSQQPCSSHQAALHSGSEHQPCSSRESYPATASLQHFYYQTDSLYPYDSVSDLNDAGGGGGCSLSEQLADELFVASPEVVVDAPPQNQSDLARSGWALGSPSPNDIYQQIVCECRELEREVEPVARVEESHDIPWLERIVIPASPYPGEASPAFHPAAGFDPITPGISPSSALSLITCPNCQHSIDAAQISAQQSLAQSPAMVLSPPPPLPSTPTPQPGGAISLEELVKMVVSAVRESGIVLSRGRAMTTKTLESPEEILERKRIQNNEAAARYRRRLRNAKTITDGEIGELLRRNTELRQEVEAVWREVQKLRTQLSPGRCGISTGDC